MDEVETLPSYKKTRREKIEERQRRTRQSKREQIDKLKEYIRSTRAELIAELITVKPIMNRMGLVRKAEIISELR